ncbi:MAG: type II toxin-antitoxin system RelE/ParE family toxin [Rhodoferax sp.]|nr:type II toxin-antitoxin system RelE/ParE family toxin [Rhodoferax sp.]
MTRRVSFAHAARTEFMEAAAWYEARRPNLGVEFIAEIDRCVSLAAEQPELYAVVHKDVRRVATRRFPYGIYFRAVTRRIVVLAVFHSSRDPVIWQVRA